MRISSLMLGLIFVFNITGCKLLQVKGEVGDVVVEAKMNEEVDKDNSEGDFCPPGQAKKGRC